MDDESFLAAFEACTLSRIFYSPRGRELDAEEHGFVEPDMCPLPRYRPG